MIESTDPKEFRLNTTTVTEVFGHFALRDLARAAAAGQVDKVAQLVKAGADPNGRGKEGVTPLFWAFFARSAQGMRALLKAGANPNLPIHMTAKNGQWDEYLAVAAAQAEAVDILKILLEYGASSESVSSRDTPLTAGAACLECIKLLVQHGANVNRKNVADETVATRAAAIGHYDAIIYLLENGYNVELDQLAWYVENRQGSDQVRPKKERILAMLAAKGVKPFVPEWQKKEREAQAAKDASRR